MASDSFEEEDDDDDDEDEKLREKVSRPSYR